VEYTLHQSTETHKKDNFLSPPSAEHILGTDNEGYDVFVRLMYGGRISLTVSFIAVFLITILGVILGGVSGYFGGKIDTVIMRVCDVLMCLPGIPILLILSTVLDAFAKASLTPRVKFRIHDDHTILSMVEQGIGVSILPSMILDRAAYRLKTVPIDTPVRRTVSLSYLDKELLPLAARRFIRFMFEHIGEHLPAAYIACDNESVTL